MRTKNDHDKMLYCLIIGVSYNQPNFSSCATWFPNATIIASSQIIGLQPDAFFVNAINTIYMVKENNSQILVRPQGYLNIARTINGSFTRPKSLFVSAARDIYVDTGFNRVDMYTRNSTSGVTVMNVNESCYSLFFDTNNTLYCSVSLLHQVVKLSLNSSTTIPTVAAGNGMNGSDSDRLSYPRGIFVDLNFDLYVADCRNDRVQLFHSGQFAGITVAGNGSNHTIPINCPSSVVLDGSKNLFVADSNNNQIIQLTSNSFRCIAGCFGNSSITHQLNQPTTLSFDSYGNMFVTDRDNNQIVKFILATNSCGKYNTDLARQIKDQM